MIISSYETIVITSIYNFIMHLAGNLVFLLVLGTRVNALIGNVKTLAVYPLLGIAAAVSHLIASSNQPPFPMLGRRPTPAHQPAGQSPQPPFH